MLKPAWTEQHANVARDVVSVVLGVLIVLGIGDLLATLVRSWARHADRFPWRVRDLLAQIAGRSFNSSSDTPS